MRRKFSCVAYVPAYPSRVGALGHVVEQATGPVERITAMMSAPSRAAAWACGMSS